MIHSSAIVDPNSKIGQNVQIGPNCIIYENAIVGDNTVIDAFCEIGVPTELAGGKPLVIGEGSHIRSHSIFYEGSSFDEGLVTGHRVTVRENTVAGKNLQIGTLSDFQGDCYIGDYVRTHSNVHIGKHSKVDNYVWIFPYVVLTNDPHPPSNVQMGVIVKEYAVIATMSVILPGVVVNEHSLVGAHSLVNRDVPEGMVVAGHPAKVICKASEIKLKGSIESAYPWPGHFTRGYPDALVRKWESKFFS